VIVATVPGRLAAKVALVTGAGSSPDGVGIGHAISLLLARAGAAVVVVDRDRERGARTVAQIESEGAVAESVVADVTISADCARAVAQAAARTGQIDLLVNNVGTTSAGSAGDVDEHEWDRVMAVNVKSAALMTNAAAPWLERAHGAVVNIASIGGLVASGGGAYGASKAALIMLTRDLAVAYGRRGIRVNAIAPGHLQTPFVGELTARRREERRLIAPLGIEGDAFDVARAAVFLGGDEARFITGVCLPVDGGVSITSPLRAHQYLET
jgi:NAD(P)-dependent dehydrogenase (short-subunit alcohol dehydrogenase family)